MRKLMMIGLSLVLVLSSVYIYADDNLETSGMVSREQQYVLPLDRDETVVLVLNPVYSLPNDFTEVIALEAIVEVRLNNTSYTSYKVVS